MEYTRKFINSVPGVITTAIASIGLLYVGWIIFPAIGSGMLFGLLVAAIALGTLVLVGLQQSWSSKLFKYLKDQSESERRKVPQELIADQRTAADVVEGLARKYENPSFLMQALDDLSGREIRSVLGQVERDLPRLKVAMKAYLTTISQATRQYRSKVGSPEYDFSDFDVDVTPTVKVAQVETPKQTAYYTAPTVQATTVSVPVQTMVNQPPSELFGRQFTPAQPPYGLSVRYVWVENKNLANLRENLKVSTGQELKTMYFDQQKGHEITVLMTETEFNRVFKSNNGSAAQNNNWFQ
ncbi:MAG: hypothetical protein AAGF24_03515 [Cyanobacteria bacterium P01_H01_bin.121]